MHAYSLMDHERPAGSFKDYAEGVQSVALQCKECNLMRKKMPIEHLLVECRDEFGLDGISEC